MQSRRINAQHPEFFAGFVGSQAAMTPPSASGGFVEAQPLIERLLKPPGAAIAETTPCAHSLESAAPGRCIEKGDPNHTQNHTKKVSVWARHLDLIGTAPDHHAHDERCGDELQGGDDATHSLPARRRPDRLHRPAHCRVAHTARLRGLVDLSRRAATGAAATPRSGCSTAWAVA